MSTFTPFAFRGAADGGGTPLPPVTDNLLFYVDAGLVSSYPGSGSTWNDIAGATNVLDMTLTNSPTYTSGDAGYFSFNGSSQYASYNPGGGDWEVWDESANPDVTWELVVKETSGGLGPMFSKWGNGNGNQLFIMWLNSSANQFQNVTRENGNFPNEALPPSGWNHIVMVNRRTATYQKITYLNGSSTPNGSNNWSNFNFWNPSNADLAIAKDNGAGGGGIRYKGCEVAAARIYDKELSTAEIASQYNYWKNTRGYSLN